MSEVSAAIEAAKALLGKINTAEKAVALSGIEKQAYLRALELVYGPKEQRAAQMGFDKIELHGTTNIKRGLDRDFSKDIEQFPDRPFMGYHFTTPDADFAEHYAKNNTGSATYPLKIKSGQMFDPDIPKHQDMFSKWYLERYPEMDATDALDQINGMRDRENGWKYSEHTSVKQFLNENGFNGQKVYEQGTKNSATLNPKDIRSAHAAFDPRFADSAKIVAGVAAMPAIDTPVDYLKKGFDAYNQNVVDPIAGSLKQRLTPDVPVNGQAYPTSSGASDFILNTAADPLNYAEGPVAAGAAALQGMSALAPQRKAGGGMIDEPAGLDAFLAGSDQPSGTLIASQSSSSPEPAGLDEFIAPLQQERKYGSLGQQAIAGLEGVARGGTLGISDVLERKYGVPAADISGRMQEHPGTSLLGSVAGGAGLVGLTGGLAAPAEAVLGAGLGTELLATGAEGALFGAGSAVTDHALGDPNLNAQKVMADIGIGALLGVGAGLAGHGIKSLIGKSGNIKGSVSDVIASEADTANVSAKTASAIDALERQGLKKEAPDIIAAAERLNLPVMNGQVSADPWVQKAESALLNGAPTYSGIKRSTMYAEGWDTVTHAMEKIVPENEQLTKAMTGRLVQNGLVEKIEQESKPIGELYEAIKQQTERIPVSDKSAPAIARNILDMKEVRVSPSAPESMLARRVADEISNIQTVDDIKEYRAVFRRSLQTNASAGEKRIQSIIMDKLVNWEESTIERHAKRLINSLKDADAEKKAIFQPMVDKLNGLLEQKKIANAQYKPFIEKVSELAERLGKNRVTGAQDAINFINDLDFEQITNKLMAKDKSQFREFFAKNFPEQMSVLREYQKKALRDAAVSKQTMAFSPKLFFNKVNDLEPEIQKSIFFPEELQKIKDGEIYLRSFPKDFNPSGTSGMSAFREFFHSPGGAAIANIRDFGIETYIKTMGRLPENFRPNPHEVGDEMAKRFNSMNAALKVFDRTEKKIQDHVNSIIHGVSVSAPTILSTHSYDQKVERVKDLAENGEALNAQLSNHTDGIVGTLPTISAGLATSMTASVMFLNSKIPRPKSTLPLSGKWNPSEFQKQTFNRYYESVNDPVGVLKRVKSATINSQDMESMRATHPDLLRHMQMKLKSELGAKRSLKMRLPTRQAISLFLGEPLDDSQLTAVRMANQNVFQGLNQMKAAQASAQAGSKSTAGGMKHLKVAGRYSTRIRQEETGETS